MSASAWMTEAALVADFCDYAREEGWTPYAETAGWDVLLSRDSDGFQIGIEAKLSLNVKVLCQVIESDHAYGSGTGPDCWAVLVPGEKAQLGLATIAKRLGIVVITGREGESWRRRKGPYFEPDLPVKRRMSAAPSDELGHWNWPERCPDCRHSLPDYVPDVTGGRSAPLQLTDWKIRAIKAVILIEARGFITRADFMALGLDHRRWTAHWLRPGPEGGFIPANMPNFRAQHPVNYEQIKADAAKWMPPPQAALPLAGAG